jgi:hypothetical protein
MTKFITIILSLLGGIASAFFLGLTIAMTSGGPEMPAREIFGYFCFWTSLTHVVVSSWLFIYFRVIGSLIAILTSLVGIIGPIMIMSEETSILWISVAVCFILTLLLHVNNLIRLRKLNVDNKL